MDILEFKLRVKYFERLKEHGATVISLIKRHIESELAQHLKITSETAYSLIVCFYGCELIFRIEIPWTENKETVHACVSVYRMTPGANAEEKRLELDNSFSFDARGDLFVKDSKHAMPLDGIQLIVLDAMTALAKESTHLRP
jgi:hypothetical protein